MKKKSTKMSSEAINIVLSVSLDGTILSFSVQKVVSDDELTEVKSESNSPDVCPTCTCRIYVFTRQFSPVIKTEVLLDKEDLNENIHHDLDKNAIDLDSFDEDEKPIIELFIGEPDAINLKSPPKSKKKSKKGDSVSVMTVLRCLHCKLIFPKKALHLHQKNFDIVGGPSEPAPDAVKCTKHCKRWFENEEELQVHLEKVLMTAKKKPVRKCEQCQKVFYALQQFRMHLFTHGPVECHKCNRQFKDKTSYKKHMEIHTKTRNHLCKICNQRFDDEAILAVHIRWYHTMDRACSFCGKFLTSHRILLEHENKHRNISPHICHVCGVSYYREEALSDHLETHQGVDYVCDLCGKIYKNKCSVRNHIMYHHKEPEKVFQCDQCSKRFTSINVYRAHIKRHAEKSFPCPECGKLFKAKADVKLHIKCVHTELSDRPKFTCETCGKILFSEKSMNIHMNTHKETTEFKCRHCPYNAISFHVLKRHELIHTGERPFTCQTCGKSFRHSDTLKTHIRLHTGEKPYECPLEECKKRFSDRGCFRGHLLNHEKQLNIKLIQKKNYLNDD